MPKAQPANLKCVRGGDFPPQPIGGTGGTGLPSAECSSGLLPVSQMLSFATAKELEVANLH